MLHASLCAKIMVFRRITRIIGIVLNERTVPTAHFILPENCWLEHFYAPQFPVQEAFLKEYAGNDAAADLITGQRYEESLYNKYKEYYGYVFYIGQKKD